MALGANTEERDTALTTAKSLRLELESALIPKQLHQAM